MALLRTRYYQEFRDRKSLELEVNPEYEIKRIGQIIDNSVKTSIN
jgi:hypothetical protein